MGSPRFFLANRLLESIACLSDTMTVIASSDILDEHGNKLWAKGVPISRSFQEKIMRRRLQNPMESSLEVRQGVNGKHHDDCFALMKQNPTLAALGATSETKASLCALYATRRYLNRSSCTPLRSKHTRNQLRTWRRP